MNTTNVLTVTIIGLLAIMSPGPDFLMVTRNSLLHSRKAGLYTALGISVGNLWWVLSSLAGISLLIAKTVFLFNALKWLGALYLIYIGCQALRPTIPSAPEPVDAPQVTRPRMSPSAAFWSGLKINLLNPKAALFFVSFFSVILTPETPARWRFACGLEIAFMALGWFALVATILSDPKVKGVFLRSAKWFERITGAVLILLGVKLALYRK